MERRVPFRSGPHQTQKKVRITLLASRNHLSYSAVWSAHDSEAHSVDRAELSRWLLEHRVSREGG